MYSQVPNKRPSHLLVFQLFSNPPDLIRTPRLLILRTLTFFTNSSFHFLSLLVLFTPNFHSKIACFCTYFSFMLYDNLPLFFPSLCSLVMSLLKFRTPPPFILTHPFIKFQIIFRPPCLLEPPVYLALESAGRGGNNCLVLPWYRPCIAYMSVV